MKTKTIGKPSPKSGAENMKLVKAAKSKPAVAKKLRAKVGKKK